MKKKAAKLLMLFWAAGLTGVTGLQAVQAEENTRVEVEINKDFTYRNAEGLTFCFSSGVGAWGTILKINGDGTFEGYYRDTNAGESGLEYPNGTVYKCNFSGKFTDLEKVSEYIYSAEIESIQYRKEPGSKEIIEGVQYVYSEPYGIANAEKILFYMEGMPIEELPEDYVSWAVNNGVDQVQGTELPFIGMYNEATGEGFSSYIEENTGNTAAVEEAAIDRELADLEAREVEIDSQVGEYADQSTMNIAAQERYVLWDDELNSIWDRLQEKLSADVMDPLTQEQIDWIYQKEAAVAAAVAEVEGGSMSPMVEYGTAAKITKERVYVLAEYLR